MTNESISTDSGSGEFAVGFSDADAAPQGHPAAAAVLRAVTAVQTGVANVATATHARIMSCLNDCNPVLEDCKGCISGRITNLLTDINAVTNQMVDKIVTSRNEAVNLATAATLEAVGEFPPEPISTAPGHGSTGGIPVGCPTGSHSVPFFGCVHDSVHLGDSVPVDTSIPVNPPDEPLPPVVTPACIAHYPPAPSPCTLNKCANDCRAAGGSWGWDEAQKQWLCKWPDGTQTQCYSAADNRTCFPSRSDCAAFIQYAGALGWEMFQPDDDNADHWAVRNVETGEVIYCENQGPGCDKQYPYNPQSPCPKPPDAPDQSWLVVRDDGMATYIDRYGNTYGELCDLSDCMPPPGYWGYNWGPVWVKFQDGCTGWWNGWNNNEYMHVCCPPIEPDPVTPALDTADEWIAQQDEPENWDVVFDDTTGVFVLYNDQTGEVVELSDQAPESPGGGMATEPPDQDCENPDITIPRDEYTFAGRD